MLSSAASAQMPEANVVPGLRNGALSSAMMTGAPSWAANSDNAKDNGQQSTGLTPFLSFSDSQAIDNAAAQKQAQERQPTEMSNGSGTSRRTSQYSTGVTSDSCPAGPSVLSPNNFFNFSPGPSGPTAPGPTQNLNWAPPPGPDGQIQPSTRTEGPWRAVETVDTVLQGIGNPPVDEGGGDTSLGQSTDVDMDPGFPPVDEAIQQQLLMDLFWPGWPPNLPEPHIVNELYAFLLPIQWRLMICSAEAFFELVPNLNRLLHRARFLARLALPPTHPNFPHPALVHAMCASSAAWCAPAVYQRGSTLSSGDGCADMEDLGLQSGKSLSFGLKQAAYGKEAVQDGLNTGNRLFDVVRAMIILSRVFIDDTR